MDTGARGATNSFARRGLGDVLLAWENEAWLARNEFGADAFEIVYPSSASWPSRLSRWLTASWTTRGSRALAESYLQFLYTREAQEIITRRITAAPAMSWCWRRSRNTIRR